MKPSSRTCDRCGIKEGSTRPGRLQGEILAPLEQIGRTYLLCTKCRRKLTQYKPIAR